MSHIISHLTKSWKALLLTGLLFALAAGVATTFFPLEYRADAQVLIISKSRYGVDPYTVVKSAERIGENLAQVVHTDDFYQKVISQTGQPVDTAPFDGVTDRVRRKRWAKAVNASVVYGTGVLNVSAYSTDRAQAVALAGAASDVLVSRGWEYVGGDVSIKEVNPPVATKYQVRPNVVLNTLVAFVVGMILAGLFISRK